MTAITKQDPPPTLDELRESMRVHLLQNPADPGFEPEEWRRFYYRVTAGIPAAPKFKQFMAEVRARCSVPLCDIVSTDESTSAKTNLIGNGFLRRGQTVLFPAATGVGKSVLTTQGGVSWSVGRPCLGLRPQGVLRVLIVQSENDDSDIAEMRDGILAGLALGPDELALYKQNVRIVRSFKSGPEWFEELEPEVVAHKPDLLIVDPLFAFAGVDLAKDQPGLSKFLRGLLLPFSIRHNLGVLLVHHTNKPPSSAQNRSTWQAGDFAYSGSGHNELANFARGVIVLRTVGSRTVLNCGSPRGGSAPAWSIRTVSPLIACS